MDQNPWDFIWGAFAFSEVSLTSHHQVGPNTPSNLKRGMPGGLSSCICLLMTLTKHFQQVLRCSSYLHLDISWNWLSSNDWFFQKFQMTSSSLSHLFEGTCFRLTIPSSMAFLSTTHTATQMLAILLWALAYGWVSLKIRDWPHLWEKQSSINLRVSAWHNMKSLKTILFSLKSLFRMFWGCGPGMYFANWEIFQILMVEG